MKAILRYKNKALLGLIRLLGRFLDNSTLERLAFLLAADLTQRADKQEVATLLMQLDNELYSLEGPAAKNQNNGVHPKHELTNYHTFFIERIRQGERVLDIGCGTGVVANDLATLAGARVDGVDHDAENIAEAKRLFSNSNLNFVFQDALTMEVDEPYDVVLLSNVLEHIAERTDFLRRIVSMAKPNRVFIRVPLFERDWRVAYKKALGLDWRLDTDHKTEFTLESFNKEMKEAGLNPTHLEVRWGEIWSVLEPIKAS